MSSFNIYNIWLCFSILYLIVQTINVGIDCYILKMENVPFSVYLYMI